METAILDVREVTVVRDGRTVVEAATLTLDRACILTVQGGSGSGKSTLLRAIASLIPRAHGRVLLEGREQHDVGIIAYRRRVAYVPQLPRMFEGTVADNVRTGPRFRGVSLNDDEVATVVERVGLPNELCARDAAALSGGERLRVALARALANDPRVLLLDEPTSALDPDAAAVVLDLLIALSRSGTAILVVTHAEEHAARLGGKRMRMTAGVLRAEDAEAPP